MATVRYEPTSPSPDAEPGDTGEPGKPFSCAVVQWLAQMSLIAIVVSMVLEAVRRKRERQTGRTRWGEQGALWWVKPGEEPLLLAGQAEPTVSDGGGWDAPPAYEEKESPFTPRGEHLAPQWPASPQPHAEGEEKGAGERRQRAEGEGEADEEREGESEAADMEDEGLHKDGEGSERKQREREGEDGEAHTAPLVLMSPADDAHPARLVSPRGAFRPRVMLDLSGDTNGS